MKHTILLFIIFLVSCKVTDKTVVGTYTESGGKKIVLNPDKTCAIDIEVSKANKKVSGHWTLKDNFLLFKIDDVNFKYLDSISYEVKGKAIKTPNIKMWPHNVVSVYKKIE